MRNLNPEAQEQHAPYYLWNLSLNLYTGIYNLEQSFLTKKVKKENREEGSREGDSRT